MKSLKILTLVSILVLAGCMTTEKAKQASSTMEQVEESAISGASSTQSTIEGVESTFSREQLDDMIRKGDLLSY